MKVRCKDYFIIKIRYYADDRLLKKTYNSSGSLPKQHYDRAEEYVRFMWKMVEEITKKKQKYWVFKYVMDSRACAFESIEETHGIILKEGEGWTTFMIPLKHINIISWMKENVKLPYKIVSRTNISFISWTHNDLQWRRKMSREFTKGVKTKLI